MKVTGHRAAVDFAQCMRELADVHYPHAERIRVVLDNLSTHAPEALYMAFPPQEARRILQRMAARRRADRRAIRELTRASIDVRKGSPRRAGCRCPGALR